MRYIEAVLVHVVFHSEETGFCVGRYYACGGQVDANGNPLTEFTACGTGVNPEMEELTLRLEGDWTTSKYGVQFSFKKSSIIISRTRQGIVVYLSKALKGVGVKTANAIYDAFGDDTMTVLEQKPERLLEIPGVGKKTMLQIADSYIEQKASGELVTLLLPYNVPYKTCLRIYKKYGAQAIGVIKENPYRIADVDGVGFGTSEAIAKAVGMSPHFYGRLAAGLMHVLSLSENGSTKLFGREGGGHLCIPAGMWIEKTMLLLNGEARYAADCVANHELETIAADLITRKDVRLSAKNTVSRDNAYGKEVVVARQIARIMSATGASCNKLRASMYTEVAEMEAGIRLADEQRKAVQTCLMSPLTIITGGPGTGKSTILTVLLKAFSALKKDGEIVLCAPTGKAARRMRETTDMNATTIHSRLQLRGDEENEQKDEYMNADLVVVDECSMIDIYLAKHLLCSVPTGAKLVLVGDADQLPSIGPGAFLRDVIDCEEIPVVRLDKIYRQGSGSNIVSNAKLIKEGDCALTFGNDFLFVESPNMEESAKTITSLYLDEVARLGNCDDVVVLTPYRTKTETCANVLSKELRDMVNPARNHHSYDIYKKGEREYRVGDKVIQNRNIIGVSNGDTGYIISIRDTEDGRSIEVDYGDGAYATYYDADVDQINLAYAMTVHKSQGSEYKTVIINLQNRHGGMLERNLIYTAATRAKEKVIIVGEKTALDRAIRTESSRRRMTLLQEKIKAQAIKKASQKAHADQIGMNL